MLAALMPLINFERLIEDLNQPGSGQSLRSESVWLYHGILPLRTVWNAREYGDDAASIAVEVIKRTIQRKRNVCQSCGRRGQSFGECCFMRGIEVLGAYISTNSKHSARFKAVEIHSDYQEAYFVKSRACY
ncbi:hypothetical protein An02g13010 [Aspergillus niger]|uniref:Uncharacterized protein n=2 Tax=Aspergillus niger TaxID=5061 RepID=A2QF21_ASPNC|nr:hypothetical protein An02g13010 [Aspergillus niger]CAK37929.1 hypothetical protein An02g13010 [Aspergillus niger]